MEDLLDNGSIRFADLPDDIIRCVIQFGGESPKRLDDNRLRANQQQQQQQNQQTNLFTKMRLISPRWNQLVQEFFAQQRRRTSIHTVIVQSHGVKENEEMSVEVSFDESSKHLFGEALRGWCTPEEKSVSSSLGVPSNDLKVKSAPMQVGLASSESCILFAIWGFFITIIIPVGIEIQKLTAFWFPLAVICIVFGAVTANAVISKRKKKAEAQNRLMNLFGNCSKIRALGLRNLSDDMNEIVKGCMAGVAVEYISFFGDHDCSQRSALALDLVRQSRVRTVYFDRCAGCQNSELTAEMKRLCVQFDQ